VQRSPQWSTRFVPAIENTLLPAFLIALAVLTPTHPAGAGSLKSWDKTKAGSKRWKVLDNFGDAAVLDSETGLVWEQAPTATTTTLYNASAEC
jgi:hypothetical protein